MTLPLPLLANDAWPLWDDVEDGSRDDTRIEGWFDHDLPDGTLDTAVVRAVERPLLLGYAPAQPNGRAMLVLGGGGYTQLMVGREGIQVVRWLTGLGFHAFLLVHRLPDERTGPSAPLDDARRAMELIAERNLAPGGLGLVGLSSGGHLAAALLANYPAVWTGSERSTSAALPRPAVAVIGYAPISTNAAGRTVVSEKPPLEPPAKQALYDAVQPDVQLAAAPPPTFIVYAGNDPVVPVANAYRLAAALGAAGAGVELHVFADAPHGFAMDTVGLPVSRWPALCEAWLRQTGFLPD
jgi:acetyl esterase/lipase